MPQLRIYFDESLDGTFILEEEDTGFRYFDMQPHDIAEYLDALQEEYNLDGMSAPTATSEP